MASVHGMSWPRWLHRFAAASLSFVACNDGLCSCFKPKMSQCLHVLLFPSLQLGVPADAAQQASQGPTEASSSSSSSEALLPLAERCLQLWEARCLVRCGSHMSAAGANTALRQACARLVFRLGSSSSSSGQAAVAKECCKVLCLAVHPDKVPEELKGFVGVFNEAFRVLQQAKELVLGCSR
jgi:hypothetical protein